MFADFSYITNSNKTVAVALSGGSDSMALIHFATKNANRLGFKVVALNVEHGIRGKNSIDDSIFVKEYCKAHDIPLIYYAVDCPKYALEHKLSLEQSARILRYRCFFDALENNKCDVIATAHHQKDNAESILLSLFRGTGIKGLAGITEYSDKIIRPLLYTPKSDIEEYVAQNNLPFVTDQTNFSDEYTRNYIRLNVLSEIQKVFPEAISSISRLSKIAREEDAFLDSLANSVLTVDAKTQTAKIIANANPVLIKRATIIALKALGITKDWEMTHVESVCNLKDNQTGAMINLPKNLVAIREYDNIVIYHAKTATPPQNNSIQFALGPFEFGGKAYEITSMDKAPENLKDGLYADGDKIPNGAIIRSRRDGDKFTKFGGGTKSLSDYLTDKKIPLKSRDELPLLCVDNEVYVIFGIAVSNKIKIDKDTENIIKFTKGE